MYPSPSFNSYNYSAILHHLYFNPPFVFSLEGNYDDNSEVMMTMMMMTTCAIFPVYIFI